MPPENFTNEALLSQTVPKLSELTFEPLATNYALTHRLVSLAITASLMLVLLFTLKQSFWSLPVELEKVLDVVLWSVGSIGLLRYLYCYFADPKKTYALREQDISYRCGLIFSKTVSQPILRVQHVELKRGPIERKVGLASLQVFSAGGSMHTFEIPGLEYHNAETIRQFILSHKDLNQHG